MPAPAFHIVVVGAGIVGAAVAEALALDGHRVTVVDASIPSGGATAAGMGHIVVMDDSEPQVALTSYSQSLWDHRGSELPATGERAVCGTLWVAADDEEIREVRRKHAFYQNRGVKTHVLDEQSLREAEPNLRPGLAGGLLVPGDSVVYPPPIVAWMLNNVRDRGGAILICRPVESMTGHQVHLEDGSEIECDYAVNACGSLASTLCPDLDVQPKKGHLVITDRYPGYVKHQIVELGYLKSAHQSTGASVAFNVQPRPTGQVLIGSSRQLGDRTREVDHEILGKMIRRAAEYMPTIGKLSAIRAWTGHRAATSDKLPLIGPHPADPNLLLATGHEGLGITTALGTARLIADHIAGRTPAIPAEPYLPARMLGSLPGQEFVS
jgi:glycine/D-amino acid oxidase-like deaminating enzyme